MEICGLPRGVVGRGLACAVVPVAPGVGLAAAWGAAQRAESAATQQIAAEGPPRGEKAAPDASYDALPCLILQVRSLSTRNVSPPFPFASTRRHFLNSLFLFPTSPPFTRHRKVAAVTLYSPICSVCSFHLTLSSHLSLRRFSMTGCHNPAGFTI